MHLCKLWVSWVLYCRLTALGKWNEMGFNFGVKNWRFICSFVLLPPPQPTIFLECLEGHLCGHLEHILGTVTLGPLKQ